MQNKKRGRELSWRALGETVQGASHRRTGQPNQDAVRWEPQSGCGPPLIVAVSDGHGSVKSFRSERGSRYAVGVAVEEAQRLLADLPPSLSAVKRVAEEQMPRILTRAWAERVTADMYRDPFTESERCMLAEQGGATAVQAIETNPLLAYGATLLLAVATENFLLAMQLGDGDIVTVSATGTARRPLESDPRLFAGETTSLCLNEAWQSFGISIQPFSAATPALVLLSTDGYANSYREDSGYLRVGPDLLSMIREDGLETVQPHLADWMNEVSRDGSGDDITLGLMWIG